MAALLQARGLRKAYRSGEQWLQVLDGCDLSVQPGERVAIVGPSGVGKSTLLHLLGGLDRPDGGVIEVGGRRIDRMPAAELARFRNASVGMVFQFYHLLPELTAAENVMMPLLIGGRADEAADRAADLLGQVGLAERAHHFPAELSGGERQRVAIARALACAPDLLLADEPTGNLDQDNGVRVMQVLEKLHRAQGTTTVLVTHNPDLTAGFDRVLVMRPGGLLEPASARAGRS